jgi:hypothetical protein
VRGPRLHLSPTFPAQAPSFGCARSTRVHFGLRILAMSMTGHVSTPHMWKGGATESPMAIGWGAD